MRISELIERLQDIQAAYPDRDLEVRLAIQPQWAFEYSVHSLSCLEGLKGEDAPVVYLSEGSQLGYLPRAVKDVAW